MMHVPNGRRHIAEQRLDRERLWVGQARTPRLRDHVSPVGHDGFYLGHLPAWPSDADFKMTALHPKAADRLIRRQITAGRDDFLLLHPAALPDGYLRADPVAVRPFAVQRHAHARASRLVFVKPGRLEKIVHDGVHVAVIVEVGQGHAL